MRGLFRARARSCRPSGQGQTSPHSQVSLARLAGEPDELFYASHDNQSICQVHLAPLRQLAERQQRQRYSWCNRSQNGAVVCPDFLSSTCIVENPAKQNSEFLCVDIPPLHIL